MAEAKSDGVGNAPLESIESLFAAQETALLTYARRILNQDDTAQDVVQEAFMRLHADFSTVKQPQAWLYRTVHNLALNHIRKNRKVVPLIQEEGAPEPPDTQPVPDEYIQRMEAIGQTRLCLDELDSRSRELVRLKFEEGLSYREISQRANMSISNVGYILHHALKDLSSSLKKAGVRL